MIQVGKAYKTKTKNIFYIAKHIEGNKFVFITKSGWEIRQITQEFNYAELNSENKHSILKASFIPWSWSIT